MPTKRDGIFLKLFFKWLPLGAAIFLLSGLIYGSTQQDYRQSANDPQIQMAEDAAVRLANGYPIRSVLPAGNVDIAVSLAPYMGVYDAEGKPLAASGSLHGEMPIPPDGVFSFADEHGEDRITWQPESGVREAVVIRSYAHNGVRGYVLAGRSLREVEQRENNLTMTVGLGTLITLGVTLFLTFLFG